MAIKPLKISVVPGKMEPKHKIVVDDALNGRAITEGSIGCLLVAAFACSDLDTDGKTYQENGQWRLCRFKKQWQAALAGQDDFSDEEKALILGARELTRNYSHGRGEKAISQPHVGKLLDSWLGAKAESATASTSSRDSSISPCYQPESEDAERILEVIDPTGIGVSQNKLREEIELEAREQGRMLCPDWWDNLLAASKK